MPVNKKLSLYFIWITLGCMPLFAGQFSVATGVYADQTGAFTLTQYMEVLGEVIEHFFLGFHSGLDYVSFPSVDGVSSATSLSRPEGENNTKRYEASTSLKGEFFPFTFSATYDLSQEENFQSFGIQPYFSFNNDIWNLQLAYRFQEDNFKVAPFFQNFRLSTQVLTLSVSRVVHARLVLGGFSRLIHEKGDFRDFILAQETQSPQNQRISSVSGLHIAYAPSGQWTLKNFGNFSIDTWKQISFSWESQLYRKLLYDLWLQGRYRFFRQEASTYRPNLTETTPGIFLQYAAHIAHELGIGLSYNTVYHEIFFRYDYRIQSILSFHVFQMGYSTKW